MIVCVDWALDRPRLLIVLPVKVTSVEVPALFVTVRVTEYVPPLPYVCETVGEVVVTTGVPSPKSHWYCAMVPTGDEEPEPSKETVRSLTSVVKTEIGAWSGVMAMFKMSLPASKVLMRAMGAKVRSKTSTRPAFSPT